MTLPHRPIDQRGAQDAVLTAVDIGSNSLCLVQARVGSARLEIVRREREAVQLAAGIDAGGRLAPAYQQAAIACLTRFGAITRALPPARVCAVATSAVRRLAQPQPFLAAAAAALGQPVHLIDGHEEGRLVWRGATAALPPADTRRLIIDIGGGSTECITGHRQTIDAIVSVDIGCVVASHGFFADGEITALRWQRAVDGMGAQIEALAGPLCRYGWDEVWATSGAARAIGTILAALGTTDAGITAAALAELRARLLDAGHVERLQLPALTANGRHVIPGTVTVLEALSRSLGIDHMGLCPSAMRGGIIRTLAAANGSPLQAQG